MDTSMEVRIPNLGNFDAVLVIEVHVKTGDSVEAGDSLVTLESEKATMEVPSPSAVIVKTVAVKSGDTVSEGSLVLTLATACADPSAPQPDSVVFEATAPVPQPPAPIDPAAPFHASSGISPDGQPTPVDEPFRGKSHATPSVRRFARELGVNLGLVTGSGPLGRILREDVLNHVKDEIAGSRGASAPAAAGSIPALNLPSWPSVDFGKFGPTESKPLSRIRKISGANLHRNWVMIPHVTNHEEADITELEAYRTSLNKEQGSSGVKITLLAFLIRAAVPALKSFPEFNASLVDGDLVLKKYYNIGFVADTPGGLVVPVIRNVDEKILIEIAGELSELSAKAREGRLSPADMEGGCFTISSLGGIGGTGFTPIINAPEVAILGVCRSGWKAVWNGERFAPRLILPLSLSWDHRVLGGAAAMRFCTFYAGVLADMGRTKPGGDLPLGVVLAVGVPGDDPG